MRHFFLLVLVLFTGVTSGCSPLAPTWSSSAGAAQSETERAEGADDDDDDDDYDAAGSNTNERSVGDGVVALCSTGRALPKSHPGHDC